MEIGHFVVDELHAAYSKALYLSNSDQMDDHACCEADPDRKTFEEGTFSSNCWKAKAKHIRSIRTLSHVKVGHSIADEPHAAYPSTRSGSLARAESRYELSSLSHVLHVWCPDDVETTTARNGTWQVFFVVADLAFGSVWASGRSGARPSVSQTGTRLTIALAAKLTQRASLKMVHPAAVTVGKHSFNAFAQSKYLLHATNEHDIIDELHHPPIFSSRNKQI